MKPADLPRSNRSPVSFRYLASVPESDERPIHRKTRGRSGDFRPSARLAGVP
jgi:hypothetical protein